MKKGLVAIASITVGGVIYVGWRPESLRMFSWFETMGLEYPIMLARCVAQQCVPALPSWALYSLPQALWILGGLTGLSAIWSSQGSCPQMLWSIALISFAVLAEMGQFVHLLPGAFDVVDVGGIVAAGLAGLSVFRPSTQEEEVHGHEAT